MWSAESDQLWRAESQHLGDACNNSFVVLIFVCSESIGRLVYGELKVSSCVCSYLSHLFYLMSLQPFVAHVYSHYLPLI